MHQSVKNIIDLYDNVKQKIESLNYSNYSPQIIAVSKTFSMENILPLINYGHLHFGENKVQEALDKWTKIKSERPELKIHLVGKLQTNKVKFAIKLFDFIHSVDSKKLAKKIAEEQSNQNKKIKIFLQVNIGNEKQKSGISKNDLDDLYHYCRDLKLDVIGLMCIPPFNFDPVPFFQELNKLNRNLNLKELSMGMSSDYLKAVENHSTYLRVGSAIFGERI